MNVICLFGSIPDRRFCRIRTTADVVYVPYLSAGESLTGHRKNEVSGAIRRGGRVCVAKLHKYFINLKFNSFVFASLFLLDKLANESSLSDVACRLYITKKIMLLLSDKEDFIGKVEL